MVWHDGDAVVHLVAVAVSAVIYEEYSTRVSVLDDAQVLDVDVLQNLVAVLSGEDDFDELALGIEIVDDLDCVLLDRRSEYSDVEGLGQVLDDVLCIWPYVDFGLMSVWAYQHPSSHRIRNLNSCSGFKRLGNPLDVAVHQSLVDIK